MKLFRKPGNRALLLIGLIDTLFVSIMRRSFFEEPNVTTMSPMLALLPGSVGSVSELRRYSEAFFARSDKVEGLIKALEEEGGESSERLQSLEREQEMLKLVLNWIWRQGEGNS